MRDRNDGEAVREDNPLFVEKGDGTITVKEVV